MELGPYSADALQQCKCPVARGVISFHSSSALLEKIRSTLMNLLIEKARIRDRVFVVIVRLITALARSGECGDSDMVGKIFHMYVLHLHYSSPDDPH